MCKSRSLVFIGIFEQSENGTSVKLEPSKTSKELKAKLAKVGSLSCFHEVLA